MKSLITILCVLCVAAVCLSCLEDDPYPADLAAEASASSVEDETVAHVAGVACNVIWQWCDRNTELDIDCGEPPAPGDDYLEQLHYWLGCREIAIHERHGAVDRCGYAFGCDDWRHDREACLTWVHGERATCYIQHAGDAAYVDQCIYRYDIKMNGCY